MSDLRSGKPDAKRDLAIKAGFGPCPECEHLRELLDAAQRESEDLRALLDVAQFECERLRAALADAVQHAEAQGFTEVTHWIRAARAALGEADDE